MTAANPNTANTTVTVDAEPSLLDLVLAETRDYVPTAKRTDVTVVGASLDALEIQVVAATQPKAPADNVWVTDKQRETITKLRAEATALGGDAARLAAEKCQPTQEAAARYTVALVAAIAKAATASVAQAVAQVRQTAAQAAPAPAPTPATTPRRRPGARGIVARAGLPATPKQWGLIGHLRDQLRKVNEPWAREMAGRRVDNDRRAASNYIAGMQEALKRQYTPQAGARPSPNGNICSVCWVPGCGIGPMVGR